MNQALRQAILKLRWETAASRLTLLAVRLHDALLELSYNPGWPNQPRAPAGDPAGGRWTSGSIGLAARQPDRPTVVAERTKNFNHACRALKLDRNKASATLHTVKEMLGLHVTTIVRSTRSQATSCSTGKSSEI